MGLQLVDETGALISGANPLPVEVSGPLTATLDSASLAALEQTSAQLIDAAGNPLASSTGTPAGTERALIVRPIPSGTQAVSVASLPLPTNAATDAEVAGIRTDLGTDGASAPSIPGTGVRGWLRSIYDRLSSALDISDRAARLLGKVAIQIGGADNAVGNPLFTDPVDRAGRALGVVTGTVTANQGTAGAQAWPVSGPLTDTQLRASAVPVSGPLTDAQLRAAAVLVSGPLTDAQLRASAVPVMPKANDLSVSATAAAAAAVTATLPGVPGQYHYIDAIEITCYASAAGTGGATPVTVTSTNLPTANAWTFPSGRAIGTIIQQILTPNRPVRSAAAGAATTIVCPATTGVIWRVNVYYTTGP